MQLHCVEHSIFVGLEFSFLRRSTLEMSGLIRPVRASVFHDYVDRPYANVVAKTVLERTVTPADGGATG